MFKNHEDLMSIMSRTLFSDSIINTMTQYSTCIERILLYQFLEINNRNCVIISLRPSAAVSKIKMN